LRKSRSPFDLKPNVFRNFEAGLLSFSKVINERGNAGGAKAIVDIDHRNVG
jgi:hypothetical protein